MKSEERAMYETLFGIPVGLWLMLIIALAVSSLGFFRTVYFVSIGYTFSIVAMVVVASILMRRDLALTGLAQGLGLAVWGVRLGWFIVARELAPSYQNERRENNQRGAGLAWWTKGLIWMGVSLLYVCMYSPHWYVLAAPAESLAPATWAIAIVGLGILWGGSAIEAIADRQKSRFKAQHPKAFCNVGLYRWVRCPNYWGEIMVWLGSWLVGLGYYHSIAAWVLGVVGLLCIVLVMMGSTKRLEASQAQRYGASAEFKEYVRTVPVLFPWLPVYSLKNVRVFIE